MAEVPKDSKVTEREFIERSGPNLIHDPTTKYKINNMKNLVMNVYMTSCAPINKKSKIKWCT